MTVRRLRRGTACARATLSGLYASNAYSRYCAGNHRGRRACISRMRMQPTDRRAAQAGVEVECRQECAALSSLQGALWSYELLVATVGP